MTSYLKLFFLSLVTFFLVNVINAQEDISDSFLSFEIQSEYAYDFDASVVLFWRNGKPIFADAIPSLPINYTLSSGTITNNHFYALAQKGEAQKDENQFLLIHSFDKESDWEIIASPIKNLINNVSLEVQGDGVDNCLFLFGGTNAKGELAEIAFKYNLKTEEWSNLDVVFSNYPEFRGIYGNAAVAIGNSEILFLENRFENSIWSDSIQGTEIGIYNTITNAYVELETRTDLITESIISKEKNRFSAVLKDSNGKSSIYSFQLLNNDSGFSILDIIVLVLYFVIMMLIGFYFSKKQKTEDDYFKAGKRIPWWAAGLSLIGTGLSAISFMAVPAKAFATDWAYYMIRLPTILIPILIGLLYIPIFRSLDVSTAYEYLQKRFNLATRLIGSLSFILFQLGRIGIVLFLPSVALNVVTGFDVVTCIVLMGIVSLVYTIMGGIEAVIWTDVIQVVILYGGIILCVGFISFGLDNGISEIISIGKENEKFNIFNMSFSLQDPNFWVVVCGSFFTSLTTYGSDQTMVQRYMTTKTDKDATKSIWVTVFVGFLLGWLFFFMGTALFAYYKTNPGQMLHTMESNDAIFPWYIISQLPAGLSGLLIAGIFAAAMSSLSSSMNSGATAYTMDFHKLFKKEFDAIWVGRIVTLLIGLGGILFAILFATLNVKSIWDEFLKIIGLLTGGLGGVFLLGIITKRANGAGVLVGLFASSIIQYYVGFYKPFNLLLFTASGFVSCFIIGYLSSLFFPKYNKSIDGLTIYTVKPEK
jgi:solute:Na+ symporter, SSS family